MELDLPITSISGIGRAKAERLSVLGIKTVGDMLSYFPASVEDRRVTKKITELSDGETACISALLISSPSARYINKATVMFTLPLRDDTGSVNAYLFSNRYAARSLSPGSFYNFYGKITVKGGRKSMNLSVIEPIGKNEALNRIVPVYRLTKGLTQRFMLSAVKKCFDAIGTIEDPLPGYICEKYRLCRADYALRSIHFPSDDYAFACARKRLAFEELFTLQLALILRKDAAKRERVLPFDFTDASEFVSALPYRLTNAQKRVLSEIEADLASARPMNRLVQGDVGSGKTAIAAAALYICAKNGCQGALMAPTELLAKQHFDSLSPLLSSFGIKCALLVGSTPKKEKAEIYKALSSGEIQIAIGTHALFQEGVAFRNLRLVVTDEQHRFGVRQRGMLVEKGCDPHVLVMTATPIPRTLALIIYGDLDVSIIDEMPPGRQKIDTFCIGENGRGRMYKFVEKEVKASHKVYIVCPAVDESEDTELKSAVEYAASLRKKIFPDFEIGLIHGKMPAAEKKAVMDGFAFGSVDILVSTTVIEVGVNVPSATLMVIENAERFGLSQLHQLRGRVGRGKDKGRCILLVNHIDEDIKKRMIIMTETNDGFKISQTDLEMRGPGEFFGTRQHGLPPLKTASLLDMETLKLSSDAVCELLASDPDLADEENQPLRARAEELLKNAEDYLV